MSGAVKLITRKTDNHEFALKQIGLSQLKDRQKVALQNELELLKSLDHPHIAKVRLI